MVYKLEISYYTSSSRNGSKIGMKNIQLIVPTIMAITVTQYEHINFKKMARSV